MQSTTKVKLPEQKTDFLSPLHRDPMPLDRLDPGYKRLQLQVFWEIFSSYAGYYLVRKNFLLVMFDLAAQSYSFFTDLTWQKEKRHLNR